MTRRKERDPATTGGIPELLGACEQFDAALRDFARQVMRMLFDVRELEQKLNGGKHVA